MLDTEALLDARDAREHFLREHGRIGEALDLVKAYVSRGAVGTLVISAEVCRERRVNAHRRTVANRRNLLPGAAGRSPPLRERSLILRRSAPSGFAIESRPPPSRRARHSAGRPSRPARPVSCW